MNDKVKEILRNIIDGGGVTEEWIEIYADQISKLYQSPPDEKLREEIELLEHTSCSLCPYKKETTCWKVVNATFCRYEVDQILSLIHTSKEAVREEITAKDGTVYRNIGAYVDSGT